MFQVKICGIRSLEDAELAISAGADAIGLNFVEQSKRRIDLTTAEEIATFAASRTTRVGVFANSTVAEIRRISDRVGLDQIQLHGDEGPECCGELGDRLFVIRAFPFREANVRAIHDYLTACQGTGLPDAVLIDGFKPGKLGGTGEVVDWQTLAKTSGFLCGLPLVLAGGLTPQNVAEAIATVQPEAVDTASGVEGDDGRKDARRVREFVAAAKRAFAEISRL